MAKTERRKKVSRWQILFVFVVLALLITIAVMVRNIFALHAERSELKEQEVSLEQKRDELNNELKNVDDLEYIEEQARKLLRMIKPGEVLYVLNESDPRPQGEEDGDAEEKVPELPPVVQEPTYEESYSGTYDTTYDESYSEEYTETYDEGYSEGTEEGYYDESQETGEYTEEYSGEEGTWGEDTQWSEETSEGDGY